MNSDTLDPQIDEIRQLLRKKLGVKGRDLPSALARAKRRLPKAMRDEGRLLVAALPIRAHPKLSRTLDMPRLTQAATTLKDHLRAIDLKEQRKTLMFAVLGSVAFNLLLVIVLAVVVFYWQGPA